MRRWQRGSKPDRHREAAGVLREEQAAVIRSSQYVHPGLVVSVDEFAV
jgi:hypothetical protein